MTEIRKFYPPDFTDEKLKSAPDCKFIACEKDGVLPQNYHSTSIFPEYYKVKGEWLLAEESRMDCQAILEDGKIKIVEMRKIKKGDLVSVGRTEHGEDGVLVYPFGFRDENKKENNDLFSFRSNSSRETSHSKGYDDICKILKYEKDHGKIVYVMGPAFAFDQRAKKAMVKLINNGYCHALLAGNALATHDLEGEYIGTALGQDIYTKESMPNGHYNHVDLINRVRYHGSIKKFCEEEKIEGGIMGSLVKKNIPFVLAGSIRDDGPLPEVIGNVYEAQDAMRDQLRDATTVICLATMLHSIATGNMFPSYRVLKDGTIRQTNFYCVDASEFVVNKLVDRGSLSVQGFVTNVQDFINNVANGLGL